MKYLLSIFVMNLITTLICKEHRRIVEYKTQDSLISIKANVETHLEQASIDCDINELGIVQNRVDNHKNIISVKDADIVLRWSNEDCLKNAVEYSQMHNEVLFRLMEIKPVIFISSIDQGRYNPELVTYMLEVLKSPIHDGINLDLIIENLQQLEESELRNQILNSIYVAKCK